MVTCITAQNPARVMAVEACSPRTVTSQLEAVFEELRPRALKTGMLYSGKIVQAVAQFLRRRRDVPMVVDPVMISTSGARLMKQSAIRVLCDELFPLAAVVTPNLHEAGLLAGRKLASVEDMRSAAKKLQGRFGCAVLVKGGHLRGLKEAVDVFYDGKDELLLSTPFIRGVRTHGTGCTYSAAITAYLVRGFPLPKAIVWAKEYIANAIRESRGAGKHTVLGF